MRKSAELAARDDGAPPQLSRRRGGGAGRTTLLRARQSLIRSVAEPRSLFAYWAFLAVVFTALVVMSAGLALTWIFLLRRNRRTERTRK
jgi:hypothetical protein